MCVIAKSNRLQRVNDLTDFSMHITCLQCDTVPQIVVEPGSLATEAWNKHLTMRYIMSMYVEIR